MKIRDERCCRGERTINGADIPVDTVFTGMICEEDSIFLRAKHYIANLSTGGSVWTTPSVCEVSNYTPLDAVLVIRGEL